MSWDSAFDAGRLQRQARHAHRQPPLHGCGVVMARSGGRWRNLPEWFGKVTAVKQRYYDWILGRTRGGLSTKIHACTDGLGDPVRPLVGPGQESDVGHAAALIEGLRPDHVLADRGITLITSEPPSAATMLSR